MDRNLQKSKKEFIELLEIQDKQTLITFAFLSLMPFFSGDLLNALRFPKNYKDLDYQDLLDKWCDWGFCKRETYHILGEEKDVFNIDYDLREVLFSATEFSINDLYELLFKCIVMVDQQNARNTLEYTYVEGVVNGIASVIHEKCRSEHPNMGEDVIKNIKFEGEILRDTCRRAEKGQYSISIQESLERSLLG